MSGGMKHDQEKPRMDLLSSIWLTGVADVLTFGAKKYAAHNWRQGINQSRLIGAALRHITAFNNGEDRDPESGINHLLHASCCVMFAYEMFVRRPDLDDRYRPDNAQVGYEHLMEQIRKLEADNACLRKMLFTGAASDERAMCAEYDRQVREDDADEECRCLGIYRPSEDEKTCLECGLKFVPYGSKNPNQNPMEDVARMKKAVYEGSRFLESSRLRPTVLGVPVEGLMPDPNGE